MEMHTATHNVDFILAQEFQKNLSNESHKHGIVDYGEHKKWSSKKSGKIESTTSKQLMMLSTKMLKIIVLLISFLCCHFMAHTMNHMVHAY